MSSAPTSGSGRDQEQQSTQHYQTFPTPPPKGKGPRQSFGSEDTGVSTRESPADARPSSGHGKDEGTPLPMKQLFVLACISLCEQTAFNSIAPYLPEMVATFPGLPDDEIGFYVGLIASAFAFSQFLTNYFWGWLSDHIGRKPVVLLGTLFTAACFVAFGFCRELWQAVVVQAAMGLFNGNQGVVSTCLGEITDKSNQSRAFTYLPVIYGLGSITGPALGGLLVDSRLFSAFPYLLPNLLAAALLVFDFVIAALFLDESLEELKYKPNLAKRLSHLFTSVWQFIAAPKPTYTQNGASRGSRDQAPLLAQDSALQSDEEDDDEDETDDSFSSQPQNPLKRLRDALPAKPDSETTKQLFTRNTILLLITFLTFQLANISFNSLYPIFAQAAEPVGRNLSPRVIGLSLAFAGAATIVFQIGVFERVKKRFGNKVTWRASLGIFILAILLMPFLPYKGPDDLGVRHGVWGQWYGEGLLYTFLGLVLLLKTIATLGGLTSALVLITNSAPSHAVLGTLNGLAQTLSAAGRAVGPIVSGALFSLAYRVSPKGEALPFGLFAGITALGFLLSFGIRGAKLESDENEGSDETDDEEDDDEEDADEEQARAR